MDIAVHFPEAWKSQLHLGFRGATRLPPSARGLSTEVRADKTGKKVTRWVRPKGSEPTTDVRSHLTAAAHRDLFDQPVPKRYDAGMEEPTKGHTLHRIDFTGRHAAKTSGDAAPGRGFAVYDGKQKVWRIGNDGATERQPGQPLLPGHYKLGGTHPAQEDPKLEFTFHVDDHGAVTAHQSKKAAYEASGYGAHLDVAKAEARATREAKERENEERERAKERDDIASLKQQLAALPPEAEVQVITGAPAGLPKGGFIRHGGRLFVAVGDEPGNAERLSQWKRQQRRFQEEDDDADGIRYTHQTRVRPATTSEEAAVEHVAAVRRAVDVIRDRQTLAQVEHPHPQGVTIWRDSSGTADHIVLDADGKHVWYVEQSRGIDWVDTQTRTPISAAVDEVATLMRPAPVATPPPPSDPAIEKERTRLRAALAQKEGIIADREARAQANQEAVAATDDERPSALARLRAALGQGGTADREAQATDPEAVAAAEHAKRVEAAQAIVGDAATTDGERAAALVPMLTRHFQAATKTTVHGHVTSDGHIALSGDTYPNSAAIKASVQQHGGSWDPAKKQWRATPGAIAHMMGLTHVPNAQDHARSQAKAEAARVAAERAATERQAQQAAAARQTQHAADQKKSAHAALDATLPEHMRFGALKGKTVALYQDGHPGGAGVVHKHQEAIRQAGAGFEPSQRRWTLRIPSRGDNAQAMHTLVAGISKAGGRVEVLP